MPRTVPFWTAKCSACSSSESYFYVSFACKCLLVKSFLFFCFAFYHLPFYWLIQICIYYLSVYRSYCGKNCRHICCSWHCILLQKLNCWNVVVTPCTRVNRPLRIVLVFCLSAFKKKTILSLTSENPAAKNKELMFTLWYFKIIQLLMQLLTF